MPSDKEQLPGTLKRSPAKAQRTYEKTLDATHETYDSDERAHRAAYASLKHFFEKVGDHWEPKDDKGPSDARAKGVRGVAARPRVAWTSRATPRRSSTTAPRSSASRPSKMDKLELAQAIRP